MTEDTQAIRLDQDGEESALITLGQFFRINADAIDAGEIDPETVRNSLADCGAYSGGGGASPRWTITQA